MTIGYVGLGKMGKNMVLRLLEQGIDVVAWNRSPEPLEEVEAAGATRAKDLEDLIFQLKANSSQLPVIVWLMLPSGAPTDEIIEKLLPLLQKDDVVIDGANAMYKDTLRRSEKLKAASVKFIDVGVSGGPGGARTGACLMIGGDKATFTELEPLFQAIASLKAYAYCGPIGAGHFAKMVHNGIEYGMMQAIAEGAAVLEASQFHYDLASIFEIYNTRSVIESRLVGWTQEIFAENPTLTDMSPTIGMLGEGEWTVNTAKELGVPVPVIETSFNVRKNSDKDGDSFRNKVVTALRGKFGGHKTSR